MSVIQLSAMASEVAAILDWNAQITEVFLALSRRAREMYLYNVPYSDIDLTDSLSIPARDIDICLDALLHRQFVFIHYLFEKDTTMLTKERETMYCINIPLMKATLKHKYTSKWIYKLFPFLKEYEQHIHSEEYKPLRDLFLRKGGHA